MLKTYLSVSNTLLKHMLVVVFFAYFRSSLAVAEVDLASQEKLNTLSGQIDIITQQGDIRENHSNVVVFLESDEADSVSSQKKTYKLCNFAKRAHLHAACAACYQGITSGVS